MKFSNDLKNVVVGRILPMVIRRVKVKNIPLDLTNELVGITLKGSMPVTLTRDELRHLERELVFRVGLPLLEVRTVSAADIGTTVSRVQ